MSKIKLSLRVRPDCEVAPWVFTEIKWIEDEIERLTHNLRVETEARDRFYTELKEADMIIASLKRRLDLKTPVGLKD